MWLKVWQMLDIFSRRSPRRASWALITKFPFCVSTVTAGVFFGSAFPMIAKTPKQKMKNHIPVLFLLWVIVITIYPGSRNLSINPGRAVGVSFQKPSYVRVISLHSLRNAQAHPYGASSQVQNDGGLIRNSNLGVDKARLPLRAAHLYLYVAWNLGLEGSVCSLNIKPLCGN